MEDKNKIRTFWAESFQKTRAFSLIKIFVVLIKNCTKFCFDKVNYKNKVLGNKSRK